VARNRDGLDRALATHAGLAAGARVLGIDSSADQVAAARAKADEQARVTLSDFAVRVVGSRVSPREGKEDVTVQGGTPARTASAQLSMTEILPNWHPNSAVAVRPRTA